ncbi:MAG: cbb3-type cytochrome oxidase assembly protein CcoS [Flavobacteriales bacterium]|nr:cbb3-type cytochrome oxidase assembly protein CcoS [Flavobacteriales bacterium]
MEVLFILIIISLVVAGGFLLAFIFSVKNGQYDDTYTPSVRMLFDDELTTKEENSNYKKSN